jgi:hypothetical protein
VDVWRSMLVFISMHAETLSLTLVDLIIIY